MPNGNCTVLECEKPLRSKGAIYCKMHYHRWYRHGSVDKASTQSGVTVRKERRYKARWMPSHPLAMKNGKVWEHRMVLFDHIGQDGISCHWCDRDLDWFTTPTAPSKVHVDHLNGETDDNRAENLVPSCRGCNTGRGAQERSARLRESGWWSQHDTIDRLATGGRRDPICPAA